METTTRERTRRVSAGRLGLVVAPVLLLAGVIALFVLTDGAGLNAEPAAPVEAVQLGRPVLRPGEIALHVRNTGPEALTIAQVNINDAIWPFTISPPGPIPRLGEAVVTLPYAWVEGEAYAISLISTNAVVFPVDIAVAAETATASRGSLLSFTLVGVYVGVIPVILGMFWLPALRSLGQRAMTFLMAATVGLLIFIGVDAAGEAIALGSTLEGPFQGLGLFAVGVLGTVLLLDAISRRQAGVGRGEQGQRMTLAWLIALGIGLHNFGEGLAIGAAYATGAAALGAFLVIGFIIQNITEGLGIVVPIARDKPALGSLALLGLLGGAPAIAGAWIGGLATSPVLTVLFLAVGVGAVFQVAYQIGRQLIWKEPVRSRMPMTIFSGVTAGMLVLYVTGLLVK